MLGEDLEAVGTVAADDGLPGVGNSSEGASIAVHCKGWDKKTIPG
jgi:hypothetical protein